MSRIFSILLLIITGVNTITAQTKHALIIAIGNYPEESGWKVISSIGDIAYIKTVLSNQGFREQHIRVVADSAAVY
jgi:metacaspase-1